MFAADNFCILLLSIIPTLAIILSLLGYIYGNSVEEEE